MELNETTLELILNRQEEKFEHRMGILVEGLRSDIQGVAEGVALLRDDVELIKADVATMKTDIEVLKTDMEIVKTDIEVLKTDMEIVKTELSIIRNDLKQKVGRDEFALLEARVAMLERSSRARN